MTNLAKHLEKINSELDECVETSKNIINELIIQDKQIEQITKITESIEEKVTWSEYLINIINSYFSFLWVHPPKFLYKNTVNDDMEDSTNIKDITEDDEDFFNKIYKVRQNSEKIGDLIDRQNYKLTTQIDTTDKINDKINEVLINQINV
jgi:hypothetical protein